MPLIISIQVALLACRMQYWGLRGKEGGQAIKVSSHSLPSGLMMLPYFRSFWQPPG